MFEKVGEDFIFHWGRRRSDYNYAWVPYVDVNFHVYVGTGNRHNFLTVWHMRTCNSLFCDHVEIRFPR